MKPTDWKKVPTVRLIDATKLVRAVLDERGKIPLTVPCAAHELLDFKPYAAGQNQRGGIRKALRCIEQAPTVDAVPVVRCKECKYADGFHIKNNGLQCFGLGENGFCSDGERKVDNG